MMHKVMTGARFRTFKAPFFINFKFYAMNIEKRFNGLTLRRNKISEQLEKEFMLMFMRLMEVGYNHHDCYLFCQKWLKIYAAYNKVNDKLLSMSDDLPF